MFDEKECMDKDDDNIDFNLSDLVSEELENRVSKLEDHLYNQSRIVWDETRSNIAEMFSILILESEETEERAKRWAETMMQFKILALEWIIDCQSNSKTDEMKKLNNLLAETR